MARGREAERMAAQHYESRGAQVLCMNYCVRGGEIDLIVREGGCIVFVEVKMRASADFGTPAEAVTPTKQRRICRAALAYAGAEGCMDEYMRFDVCEVCAGRITVHENAFDFAL